MKINTEYLKNKNRVTQMPSLLKACRSNVKTLVVFPKPSCKFFEIYNTDITNATAITNVRVINCYVVENDEILEVWHITSYNFMSFYVDALYESKSDYIAAYLTKIPNSLQYSVADCSVVNIPNIESYISSLDKTYQERLPKTFLNLSPAVENFNRQVESLTRYNDYLRTAISGDHWDSAYRHTIALHNSNNLVEKPKEVDKPNNFASALSVLEEYKAKYAVSEKAWSDELKRLNVLCGSTDIVEIADFVKTNFL